MKESKQTQSQTRPVNWQAVEMLAMNVGAREAARRLELNPNTVLSRARREGWRLPKRKGGATIKNANAITMHTRPGDALQSVHEDCESITRTGLMQAFAKMSQALAKQDALSVENIAQFKDLILAAVKFFGWEANQGPTVNVNNQVGVVVTEEKRKQLQEKLAQWQLDNLDSMPQPATAHVVRVPEPQAQSTGSQGAGNGSPEAVVKPAGEPVGPFMELGPNDNYEPQQEEPSGPSVGW